MKLKVEYINIDDIKPYAGNAKLHPAEQINQIIRSIEQFGMNDPIAIWKDGEVIEGHGRLIALTEMGEERRKALGIAKIPVIRLDELSDEQRKAYALVHNKLTMNSGFDFDLLADELADIELFDMGEFGFDVSDLTPELAEEDEEDSDSYSPPGMEEEEMHEVSVTCHTASEFDGLLKYIKKAKLVYQEI